MPLSRDTNSFECVLREETHIAVAAHSTILLTLMNAVLLTSPDAPEDANWFGTGELRTFLLRWESQ
jgi:hypothetical protein